ncbi:MAG: tandem-95 repeat protein, partial [Gammaproteobacteria bacterium]|nr:tandem-95 repeat protein [Gammaproteobacteria bacterium]
MTTQPEDTFGTVTTLVSTGKLELNGVEVTLGQNITHDDILAGLLTFTPLKDGNGVGYDSFQFTGNDGIADSLVPSTLTIDVTAVNDLPTATDNTVTATEDTAFVFVLADFGFIDVDTSDQLQSITVATLPSTGTLAFKLFGEPVDTQEAINFHADYDTIAETTDLQDFLVDDKGFDLVQVGDKVSFSLDPSKQYEVIGVNKSTDPSTITVSGDPAGDGALVTGSTIFVARSLSNIDPTWDSSNGSSVTVGQTISQAIINAGVLTFTPLANANGADYDSFNFTVNDSQADSLDQATLTIDVTAVNDLPTAVDKTVTATEDTALVFAVADFGFSDVDTSDQLQSITITTLSSTGTLTLDGSTVAGDQTISQADIAAGKLAFTPATNANGAGYDSFKFSVNDGSADSSASSTMTIDVTAVNDLPTANDKKITATESTTFVFAASNFGFMDVDTADQLQGITITALASIGELELNGADVTIGQSISQSDINVGALTFTPLGTDNGVGYDSFSYKVNDGVADSLVAATMNIDVTTVTINGTEDTSLVFTASNFGFSDVDTSDQSQGITITGLASTGVLEINGADVTVGQSISQSDISDGALTFTPLANENGIGYDSFVYEVNAGAADSSASSTLTINVTAVNDLPTAADKTVTATEDTAFVFALAASGFSDVDSGSQLQGIAVTTLSSKGTLALNGSTVTLGQSISRSNIEA